MQYKELTSSYAQIAVLCASLKDYVRGPVNMSREKVDNLLFSGVALVKQIVTNSLKSISAKVNVARAEVAPNVTPAQTAVDKAPQGEIPKPQI